MITIDNLINGNNKPVDELFIKKMINEFQLMVSQLNDRMDVEHLRNIFKQYLNYSKDSVSSSEDWNYVDDFAKRATLHFQTIGTLGPMHKSYENVDRYVNPINNNQTGWYTFQSNQLTGIKGYGKNEISHRFYITANAKVIAKFSELLIKQFEQRRLPFYFKINNNFTTGPKDFLVIYSSSNELKNTLSVINSVVNSNPDLIQQINLPHSLTNNVDNWLGYAQENKQLQGVESYTGLLSDCISKTFVSAVKSWVSKYPNATIRSDGYTTLTAQDLIKEKLLLDTGKDFFGRRRDIIKYYQGISYLLSAIQRADTTFINDIVKQLRERLSIYNVNVDNIYLNNDVMKEIEKLRYLLDDKNNDDKIMLDDNNTLLNDDLAKVREEFIRENSNINVSSFVDDLANAREEHMRQINEKNFEFDFTSSRNGTYSNHMTLPTKRNGIHR